MPAYLILLTLLCLTPGGGTVGSEYFTVRYGPGAEGLARSVHSAAMSARTLVDEKLGFAPDGPIVILLAPGGKGDFQAAQPGKTRVPEWAIGTAYPRNRTIVLRHPDNLKFRYENLDKVVTHEYAHIAIGNYLGKHRPPRWLNEGIATFLAGERTFTSSATVGIAAISRKVIPFELLDNQWPQTRNQADLAYAQSADFVSWIETEHGQGSLAKILQSYQKHGDIDRALFAAVGKNLTLLEKEWLKRVTRKYIWISILSGGFSLWFVMSLLVIMGYVRKKRQGRLKMEQWELEEEMRGLWKQTAESVEDDEIDDHPPKPPTIH